MNKITTIVFSTTCIVSLALYMGINTEEKELTSTKMINDENTEILMDVDSVKSTQLADSTVFLKGKQQKLIGEKFDEETSIENHSIDSSNLSSQSSLEIENDEMQFLVTKNVILKTDAEAFEDEFSETELFDSTEQDNRSELLNASQKEQIDAIPELVFDVENYSDEEIIEIILEEKELSSDINPLLSASSIYSESESYIDQEFPQ